MNNIISKELIALNLEATSKEEAIKTLAEVIYNQNRVEDLDVFINTLFEREDAFPTAIGNNFAIPHGKTNSVTKPSVAFARLTSEVEWSDTESAKYIFMIGVPESSAGNEHLQILAKISRKIMAPEFREAVENATNEEDILELVSFA